MMSRAFVLLLLVESSVAFLITQSFGTSMLRFNTKTDQSFPIPMDSRERCMKSLNRGLTNTVVAVSSVLGSSVIARGDETKVKTKKPKVKETELGINYIEVKKGSGAYPSPGDFVIINYTGFLSDGKVFDSTETKGRKPLSFRFGQKQVIPGLESVIENLQAGGEATCNIPAKYAYGEKGVCIEGEGCLVPPNENLKYVVKVLNVGAGYN